MMQISDSCPQRKTAAGFALPAILVVMGALLILAVGTLLVVGIERNTVRSFSDRQRAALAARAGLEDVIGIFNLEAANDDFLVFQSTLANPITTGFQSAPHLFLARGKVDSTDSTKYSYRYIPLFSTLSYPNPNALLAPPTIEPLLSNGATSNPADQYKEFTTLPYNDKVRVSWLPVKDDKGRTIARYAYWVEDLQGKIDPKLVGNLAGTSPANTHVREPYPFPAPGLNPKPDSTAELPLNQVALYAIDPDATQDQQKTLGNTLIDKRKLLLSPDSLLAAAAVQPPIVRDATGHQSNPIARAVEENLVAGLSSYLEQPLVPFVDGIATSAAGMPKLNLNQLLATGGGVAVDQMATLINTALPKWELSGSSGRKGGFPDNYSKTLAANAMDYADSDSNSTTDGATYRGIDSFPLVSEFLMRFRLESLGLVGSSYIAEISATTYVELWNMSNKPITGSAQFTHDARYEMSIGVAPINLSDMSLATPTLTQENGSYWFPSQVISLKPNEYYLYNCGTVTYRIDGGAFPIPSPIPIYGERYGASGAGYKFKWNGSLVDQSRGGLHRDDSSFQYPTGRRNIVRTTVPSLWSAVSFGVNRYNPGDVRMSYYMGIPQEANAFPINYSPNRRNVRWDLYNGTSLGATDKVQYRTLPSEWPDGGHNSTCESATPMSQSNVNLLPDAPLFFPTASSPLRNPEVENAPSRISNAGRFYSATELGRVFDPIMWKVAQPPSANLPWGDVLTTTTSDSHYGGGNTLRIGRPEHPRFDATANSGLQACLLLDLFHTGLSRSDDAASREGPVIKVEGQININTASESAIRAVAYGKLMMDPKFARRSSETHDKTGLMAPPVALYNMSEADIDAEADRIAAAVVQTRKLTPFASTSALAKTRDSGNNLVFGNKSLFPSGSTLDWTDAAAEEMFGRIYEASTVRSRNYRVWVVGQSLAPGTSSTAEPVVLGESRKVFSVFVDPGKRASDGEIIQANTRIKILHENEF